jgi:hypothetical protein
MISTYALPVPMNVISTKSVILSGGRRSGRSRRTCGCFCALLLLLISPALLRAQFQQPTAEELNMTADSKAPGAAAVYLNIEEIDNDPLHYRSVYVRIKVLTEKGKELATVELPYWQGNWRITDIKARTIHSDGTVIPLVVQPEDLLIGKTTTSEGDKLQLGQKVFNLPSVEVGSILEYRYEIRYDDRHFSSPTWEIQRPFFIHQARYSFTPFNEFLAGSHRATRAFLVDAHGNAINSLIWWPLLPPGVSVKNDVGGSYRVELTDIPAIPKEEWMPPIDGTLYHVRFYYLNAINGDVYWSNETRRWSKEVDHFASSSASITAAVSGLIAPGDSELDKAKKLYKAVQALDNTDFSRKKSDSELKQLKLKEAKHAEETWAQKSGSSQDIALLYLAMLRAAGLTAYDMKVADRSERVFSVDYLNFDQLNDDIILATIAGKDILLDPGEKMCPFQTLHWKHSGASGVRQGDHVRSFIITPEQAYIDNKMVRTGDITIDENGAITGRLNFIMTGQHALAWRQLALKNDPEELKNQIDARLRSFFPVGVEAHVDHFLGLDDPEINLIMIINVHGPLGEAASNRILLPAFFLQTRSNYPFVNEEKRLEPVDMHYPEQFTDQIVYHLPPGLTVEGVPQNNRIAWEGHAVVATKTISAPGQVTVMYNLARAFTFAKPEEYQNLRGFYQKVAAADQAQLVLAKTPHAGKGN